jgi:hypothetical protein
MNERIRQLAEQAFDRANDGTITDIKIPKEFIERFAELIVQECVDQIIEKGTDCMDWQPSQQGIRPEYVAMAQQIKRHFKIDS